MATMAKSELRIDDADGAAYTLEDFIEEYGGSAESPPCEWLTARTPSEASTLRNARSRSRSSRRHGGADGQATSLSDIWKKNSWAEMKHILRQVYQLEVQEDEDLCILSAPHDSTGWADDHCYKVLRESRGSIYEKSTGRLVCQPFFKFWNHSERHVDDIDWRTVVAEEKIDGNLMKLFYYKGDWRLASNRTLDVHSTSGKYACTGRSNYELFAEAARNSGLIYDRLDKRYCYMFERVHPDFRVVLDYPKAMLFHIGTRNMETLQELETDIGIQRPRQWKVRSRAECQALLDTFHSFAEGLVVRDARYHRQKWKRREYLMLHSARMLVGGDAPCYAWVARCSAAGQMEMDRLCLNVWLRREESEFYVYFPEAIERYREISEILDSPGFLQDQGTVYT
eukprot:symbB.v1.2.018537.t1/scaffold1482.1/size116129/2